MRKERDQQTAAVITDAEHALKEIKARAVAVHAEQLRAKYVCLYYEPEFAHSPIFINLGFLLLQKADSRPRLKFKSQCVNNICQSLERRQAIEAQMVGLVKDTHAKMKEVEDVIMAGYEGRELEASVTSSRT